MTTAATDRKVNNDSDEEGTMAYVNIHGFRGRIRLSRPFDRRSGGYGWSDPPTSIQSVPELNGMNGSDVAEWVRAEREISLGT